MKTHISPSTKNVLLLLALISLGACDRVNKAWQVFSGDERSPQVVDGARRAPLMNPQTVPEHAPPRNIPRSVAAPQSREIIDGINPDYLGQDNAPPPVYTPPPPSAPAAAPRSDVVPAPSDNFFDRYDDSGNEVAQRAAPAAVQEKTFFDRVFDGSAFDRVTTEETSQATRKPLSDNPYYARETVATAPVPPSPQMGGTQEGTIRPLMETASPAESEPAMTVVEAPPPAEQSSWLSRMAHAVSEPFNGPEKTPSAGDPEYQAVVEPSGKYPSLSSVPPTPGEFKAVKGGQQQAMEELKAEHMQAQADKQALASEPSQMQEEPVMPVAAAAPPPAMFASSPPPPPLPLANAPVSSDEPVLLGHVSDSQPRQAATVPPINVSAQAQQETPQAAAIETPRRNNWWEGWQLSSEKAAVPAEPQEIAAPPQPTPQAQPSPMIARPVPASDMPALMPAAAAPVMDEPEAQPAQAATASALPSPSILKNVKMLPPSRYSARAQTLQRPSGSQ